jgi:bacteriocin biosynthesis cyclodehydratase domain-containing protein
VRIGPLIEPGRGPCLYCLHRARVDADAAWPAIASQLWGRRSRLETALVCAEAAALASRLVLSRLRDGASTTATALDLDAASGRTVERPFHAHPQCGCRGVERLLAG